MATGLGVRGVMKPDPRTLSLSDYLATSKPLARAAAKSIKACEARGALPPGSSRARVTSANARWMRAAEERDRVAAQVTAEWEAAQEK